MASHGPEEQNEEDMADKRNKRSLSREDKPSQKTEKELKISVPKADEFFAKLSAG